MAFGFSAFLKLAHMSARRQQSEVRKRLGPREGGYDFHRRLRQDVSRHLVEGESLEQLLTAAASIGNDAERRSVREALTRLAQWRVVHPGETSRLAPAVYESPDTLFKVTFTPDFGIQLGRNVVAVHAWNTKMPKLEPRIVYGCLSLFRDSYLQGEPRADIGVLCLRTSELYRLGEAGDYSAVGLRVAEAVDKLFRDAGGQPGQPSRPGERPPSLPPAE